MDENGAPDLDDDDFNAGEKGREHFELFRPFMESICTTKEEVAQMESENWTLRRRVQLLERSSTKERDLALDAHYDKRIAHERDMLIRQEEQTRQQLLLITKQLELETLKKGGGGCGGCGDAAPTILIRSDMEYEIRDSKNFAAMAKLRTAIIRYPDRWTDVRVRDQFPESVQTDMLVGLQLMRAGGEIPADKADFDMWEESQNSYVGRMVDVTP